MEQEEKVKPITKEDLKEYIKNNLRIEIIPLGGDFEINLFLEDEIISQDKYETL